MLTFTEAMIGKPFTWRTPLYGDIAVHVKGISPNGAVAVLTIDGGEDATPAHRFPELSDGIGYAVIASGDLHKRPASRSLKREIESMRATVQNNIREVPGTGKVAVVTATPPPVDLDSMSAMDVRKYARQHYSSIAKLTKKADIIAAIRAQESKEVTF